MDILRNMFDEFIQCSTTRKTRLNVWQKYYQDVKDPTLCRFFIGYRNLLEGKYDWAFSEFIKLISNGALISDCSEFDKIIKDSSEFNKLIEKCELGFKQYILMAIGFIYLNIGKERRIDTSILNYTNANICFEKCLKLKPDNVYAMLGKATTYYQVAETKKIFKLEDNLNKFILDQSNPTEPNVKELNELAKKILDQAIVILKLQQNEADMQEIVFPILWNRLGDIYFQLGDLTKAKEAYNIAIKQGQEFAYPHNGLGRVLKSEMKWEKAIEELKIAEDLSIKNNLTFNFPLIYMGDCLLTLGQFDSAKSYYDRVLKQEEFDFKEQYDKFDFEWGLRKRKSVTFALLGLGRINYELGKNFNPTKYKDAKPYFELAKKISKDHAYVYLHFGRLLARMNQPTLAIKMLKNSKELFKFTNPSRMKDIDNYIKELDKINIIKENYDKLKELTVLNEVVSKINPAAFSYTKRHFFRFLTEDPRTEKDLVTQEFTLEVLRRWNSFTPLVMSSVGGGYFINLFGTGLVVDPGYNFVQNFRLANHKFYEIEYIWISHSHDDHTADIEAIMNLLRRYNKNLEEEFIVLRYARAWQKSKKEILEIINGEALAKANEIILKEYINKRKEILLKEYVRKRKSITLIGCNEVKSKFLGMFELNNILDHKSLSLKNTVDDNKYVSIDFQDITDKDQVLTRNKTELVKIKGEHTTYEYNKIDQGRNAFGFYVKHQATGLIYTGDTAWYNKIESYYKDVKNDLRENHIEHIVLIAHFGAYYEKELDFVENPSFDKPFYKNHLGALGLVKINEYLKPRLCIISEFGEEYSGLRDDLANIYNDAFKNTDETQKTYFLPADLGLKINLNYKNPDDAEDDDPIRVWAITNVDRISQTIEYGYLHIPEVRFKEVTGFDSIIYFRESLDISQIIDAIHSGYTGLPGYLCPITINY